MQNQISPLILTFGVSDPVGAGGIQADISSFAAMGCHGLSVITGILMGDTTRIEELQFIDPDWLSDQARLVLEDMPVAAFKIGVLGSIDNVSTIAEIVSDYPEIPLVLDPFISGMPLQGMDDEDIANAMCDLLIPQTTLLLISSVDLTLLAETWRDPSSQDSLLSDVMHLINSGCEYVLVTGTASAVHNVANTLFDASGVVREDFWPRLPGAFVGAGSTLAAAITAMLANRIDVPEAVLEAQEFTHAALTHAQRFGMGKLVPDHYFWAREPDTPH